MVWTHSNLKHIICIEQIKNHRDGSAKVCKNSKTVTILHTCSNIHQEVTPSHPTPYNYLVKNFLVTSSYWLNVHNKTPHSWDPLLENLESAPAINYFQLYRCHRYVVYQTISSILVVQMPTFRAYIMAKIQTSMYAYNNYVYAITFSTPLKFLWKIKPILHNYSTQNINNHKVLENTLECYP